MARRHRRPAIAAAFTALPRIVKPLRRDTLVTSVSVLSLLAGGMLASRPARAQSAPATTLPGTQILQGGRWSGARLPTVAQGNNGLVMTIKQEQERALLDWAKFNVAANEEVRFDQPSVTSIALNRIFDARPSEIAGKITANGQVWLANTNGVIFKGGSQVNAHSILATTTAMPDSVLDAGLLSPQPLDLYGGGYTYPGMLSGAKGNVVIEKGAKLILSSTDAKVNSKAIFLGVNVLNEGEIRVTDGQALLVAGERFLLNPYSEYYSLPYIRGLTAWSTPNYPLFQRYGNEAKFDAEMRARAAELGMRVINNGLIETIRGNIYMQGADVQQNGILTATSGVRQRSGSIVLRASYGLDEINLVYGSPQDYYGGSLTIGKNSLTQVLVDKTADKSPALEVFPGGQITFAARDILMDEGSVVRTPGGTVSIFANETPYVAALAGGDFNGSDNGAPGTFTMRKGALIDVAGLRDVAFGVGDNIVDVEVRANEVSASPNQRDGVLYGETVKVDIRTGTSIIDWTGALANRNLTAEQRAVNGGSVKINTLRSVRIDDGARIDLSGGSANYAGGIVQSSVLQAADGSVVDIANADAATKYTGLATVSRTEAGYVEGGNAGNLEILSPSQVLFGRVTGDVINGVRQIAAGPQGVLPRTPAGTVNAAVTPTRLATGATVTISTASESQGEYWVDQAYITPGQGPATVMVDGVAVTLDPALIDESGYIKGAYTQASVLGANNLSTSFRLAPGWVLVDGAPAELRGALVARGYAGAALEALLQPGAALPAGFVRGEARRFSFIEDAFASGAQNLSFNDKSDATAHYWNIQAGANLQVMAGGVLTLNTTPMDIGANVTLSAASGTLNVFAARIGAGAILSTAGLWTNDLDAGGGYGGYVNGGTINLSNAARFDGAVTLDAGGGGWWKGSSATGFALLGGQGGAISLRRNSAQRGDELLARLDIRLGGLDGAGALSLQNLGDIVVGPEGGSAPAGVAYLSDTRLNGWGVRSLSLGSGTFGQPVGTGLIGRIATTSVINPNQPNATAADFYLVTAGDLIDEAALGRITAANTAAAAFNAANPGSTPRPINATIDVAATLDVAAGAKIDLKRQRWTLADPAKIVTGSAAPTVGTTTMSGATTLSLGSAGYLRSDAASSITVAPQGTVSLSGRNVDLSGDVTARGGTINVAGVSGTGALPPRVTIRNGATFDVRGLAQTRTVQGAFGNRYIDGRILAGGAINIAAGSELVVDSGALFDVSGAAGMLTVSMPGRYGAVRADRMVGSDAGSISIVAGGGYMLGEIRGEGGTPDARAGMITLSGGTGGALFVPGSTQAPYGLQSLVNTLATRLTATSTTGLNATTGTVTKNISVNNLRDWWAAPAQAALRTATGLQASDIEPIPFTRTGATVTVTGAGGGTFKRATAADLAPILKYFEQSFGAIASTDTSGRFYLDPTLTGLPAGIDINAPLPGGATIVPTFVVPTGYTPIGSNQTFLNAMRALRQSSGQATLPPLRTPSDFTIGKATYDKLASFDTVTLGAVSLKTDLTIAAKNTLNLSGSISTTGANLTLKAQRLQLGTNDGSEGSANPAIKPLTAGVLTADARDIMVGSVNFLGFGTVNLNAANTLSGGGRGEDAGSRIYATGDLNITAGQIYPYTGSQFSLVSDKSINIFGNGQAGAAPLSAGGKLNVRAPLINQGGMLVAPFGSIQFDGTDINFLAGSTTTVSAGDRTILYGYTLDGSDWYGPTPGSASDVLLTTPPEKRITINGDTIDLQGRTGSKPAAILDASGGGDVLGLEFVQGPLGATNVLSGAGVFAISPVLGSDVALGQAPSAAPRGDLAIGDVIYLGAFDGHAAGYYTLLPAEYALTPGGYRVTVNAAGVGAAEPRPLGDGTLLVNGYQAGEQGQSYTQQGFTSFSLLSGAEVRRRSEFIETSGNSFFSSERFLTGLERAGTLFNANPRLPIDGGFLTIAAKKSLQLNGEFRAKGATAASRGGALDIASDFIVIASAGTDISDLGANYLRLDPTQLSGVAESVLIGGVRRQGAGGLEIVTGYEDRDASGAGLGSTVGAERVVVRTSAKDALTGTEFLFAATGEVLFDTGSVVRATGNGFDAEDLTLRPELAAQTVEGVAFAAQDRGALVRVSNLGDIAITRTGGIGDRGDVTVRGGVILEAADSVVLNATRNTTLAGGAIIKAGAIEAAAGSVAFGTAPDAAGGLVLTQAAFDALAGAGTLRLRSLTDFKLYGDVTLKTANDLVLDGVGIVDMDGTGANSFAARALTLVNTNGTATGATANTASLAIDVDTFNRGAGSIGLSFGTVGIDVAGRATFSGAGATTVPGALTIRASQITATGGATQEVRATGALKVLNQATATQLAPLETAGATLDLFGSTIDLDTAIALGSGVLRATATGDVTVGAHADINVAGAAIKFFEKTEYLAAGGIGLSSERGNVVVSKGAILDVSGGSGGGDAGSLILSAGRGVARLDGTMKANALSGFRGGEFSLATSTLADFGGLNAMLNTSGFSRLRRFGIADGNLLIDGVTKVERFELSTGTGSVTVAGTAQINASGDKGGTILIASGGDLMVNAGALLDVHALGTDQRGGSISLQVGDRGAMTIGAATLNVAATGTGQAGDVHLRARQIGNDVAVTGFTAGVTGGTTQLEAYRVTDLGIGNGVIDTALQVQVTDQAAAFMAGAGAIRTRLGQTDAARFVIAPGIEIRAGGDLTLVDNWNLKDARYNGAAGVLTLRAGGDLNLKANLSDGFVDAVRTQDVYAPIELNVPTLPDTLPVMPNKLTNDQSWSYNLVAGADFSQTNVLSTLVSTTGAGDVNLAGMVRTGTGDIKLAASGDLAYARPDTWTLSRNEDDGAGERQFTLTRPDGSTFTYISPLNNADNPIDEVDVPGLGKVWFGLGQLVLQDGRAITFGAPISFNVNNATIYTVGVDAPALADFDVPAGYQYNAGSGREEAFYVNASYTHRGGDISVNVGGSILGVDNPKASYDWSWWRGEIVPGAYGTADYASPQQQFAVDAMGQLQQSSTSMLLDAFRQSIGALGGGDIDIAAGGNATNLSVALPTSVRVAGGRTQGAAKTVRIDGGGDLAMQIGGAIDNGWFYVAKGKSDIRADGAIGTGAGDVTFLIDDATLKVQAGGALRVSRILSGGVAGRGGGGRNDAFHSFRPQALWNGYTEHSAAELVSLGGDVTYRGLVATGNDTTAVEGEMRFNVLPSTTRFVAPNGSVRFGEAGAMPAEIVVDQFSGGHLDVLARNDIVFYDGVSGGQSSYNLIIGWDSPNQVTRLLNPLNAVSSTDDYVPGNLYAPGGAGYSTGGGLNVHSGSAAFSALYAVNGDILSIGKQAFSDETKLGTGKFLLGQETRIKAGDDIRLGALRFYNHDADDVSMLQSGGSIYLPNVSAYGTGRMWIQAGDEIYMGNTPGYGIRSVEFADTDPLTNVVNGVDLTVLAGIDQAPEYATFLDYYLGLGTTGTRPAYLSQYFTFDGRGLGTANATLLADGTPATIYAVELVNYWNEMNGRTPLATTGADGRPLALGTLVARISKADYDAAVTWLGTLDPVKKQPLATRILFAEMKTGGREASGSSVPTDPTATRNGDPTRGYDAIGKLFPGAQRKPGEDKQAGEARWFGDIIMRDSQIRTDGGGDIEMLVPGGIVQLASLGVTNTSPASSGVLTQDGGSIYALTYGNYVVNQSRTLTADGGNLMIWSSFGNIDAGKGRKSSLSVPPVLFPLDIYGVTRVVRSGLPNGAGIATLDDVDGNPGGDVDLYAFNGIVDAGDAGIRASRDLFIGASEIRGLDNITVGGLTNVDLGDDTGGVGALNLENFARSAEDEAIDKAFDIATEVEKLRTVRQTILTGSVVSFGIEGDDKERDRDRDDDKK